MRKRLNSPGLELHDLELKRFALVPTRPPGRPTCCPVFHDAARLDGGSAIARRGRSSGKSRQQAPSTEESQIARKLSSSKAERLISIVAWFPPLQEWQMVVHEERNNSRHPPS